MVAFLVVGDGFPAEKVVAAVSSERRARLAGVAHTSKRLNLPNASCADVVETIFLNEPAGPAWVRRIGADWLLCINSVVILSPALIELFEGRALNCHPGPLPEYAGLHTHQWAIRNGAVEFGATVHRMEARVDAGPIVASRRFPIRDDDTGLSLFRRTLTEAADLLIALVPRIAAGEPLPSVPQDLSRRRLYRHREALDGQIDWLLPARAIINFVRASNYEPFRSPTAPAQIETASGALVEVLKVEPAGRTDKTAGSLTVLHKQGPIFACGDKQALQITRARDEGGLLDFAGWRRHLRL
jgi:methionyl-tRNA formyltransferase